MIKLQKLNKFYNRNRSNEIHVINNTSLELPDSGLITFLGHSGCGKTTLLNTIGGLDRPNSGRVYIDGKELTHKTSGKIDTMRNAYIGYIFQNYNLIENMTVFDNVALALKMVGIKDKEQIKERVNYCLKSVGIYQFRNRRANALSGGQRQRVGIARAIVKNPKIIIADEPTGNLDSSNTIEIMNIIKAISKERLVILVTHEKEIAHFYSSRIIEIVDGSIVNDHENDTENYLDFQLENKIYLKDMPVSRSLKNDDINIKYYSDKEREVDIKFVIRGNNLYINTGGKYNVIDEETNIEMVDEHYIKMDKSIYEKSTFEYGKHISEGFHPKYTSVFNPMHSLINGFKSIGSFSVIKKLLLFGFVLASMFLFMAVSNIAGISNIEEKDFLTTQTDYITVTNASRTPEEFAKIENLSGVDYALPGNSVVALNMPMNDYYQTASAMATFSGSLASKDILKSSDIIMGAMPKAENEIVIDEMIAEKFIDNKTGETAGINKKEQLIGRTIKISGLDDYIIVGISGTNCPALYVDESQFMLILTHTNVGDTSNGAMYESGEYITEEEDGNVKDMQFLPEDYTLKRGSLPEAANEVIVNYNHRWDMKIGKTIDTKMNNEKLTVVGYFESKNNDDSYYVTSETIKNDYISKNKSITLYPGDNNQLISSLEEANIKYQVNYDNDRETYTDRLKKSIRASLIAAGIILGISLLEIFLMLRSSFLSRIKEVGTLRAIGLKKIDIYRMFTGEIIAITLITSIPGIALMYYILENVSKIQYLENQYLVNPNIAVISFALVFVFNIVIGLLPVFKTMRKTPAAILSRTDI
jgi:ABC-type lipoprotein export system ATPase subunit/ABC-type antimicrobial peptide transport system permease subunit